MAWLSDYTYRKKITIAGQSGAGTNFQVKLLVGESSGATGEDFDVNENCEAFPSARDTSGDLRFTAADGETELSFWVQKVSGSTPNRLATIYVKVSADLGSNQDIYCYYGKSGAANASSGANTFVHFETPTSIESDWTLSDLAHATCPSYNWKKVSDGDSWTVRTTTATTCPGQARSWATAGGTAQLDAEGFTDALFFHRNNSGSWNFTATSDWTLTGTYAVITAGSCRYDNDGLYQKETQLRRASNTIHTFNENITFQEVEYTNIAFSSENINFYGEGDNTTHDGAIAYLAVRKSQATEPDFSSAGSEETELSSSFKPKVMIF